MTLDEHISDEIFERYERRASSPAETLRVQSHVFSCEECRARLARISETEKSFAALRTNFQFDDLPDEPEHLPYEQLEFFVDEKLDAVDREIAESHFAVCRECAKDLADLQTYRTIAAAPVLTAEAKKPIAETQGKSFWQRIFAFDTVGSFAPVAAVLLVVFSLGAWLLLRQPNNEIARANTNQNIQIPTPAIENDNRANEFINANASPEVSPTVSPTPAEIPANNETLYALSDGQIFVEQNGSVKGLETLSPLAQKAVQQAVQSGKVSVGGNSLGGNGGVLMGGGSADNGVPFGLLTPVGKVVKENQPVLRWKSLKDATDYSVAIVDDKFRVVEESGKLTTTNWKPSKPLARGTTYSWQVTATRSDGSETVSPSSPAPQARFRVVEQNLFNEINKLEKSAKRSHLALGVLYANAGLKPEARREFETLVKENPKSALARKLLNSFR